MGLIHVQQIKKHLLAAFSGLIDLSDCEKLSPDQRESRLLTRSLAAFSLTHLAGIAPADAAAAVTDGGQDNGIDAAYYHDADRTLYVVQSKWRSDGTGSLERGDGQKFITGFKDLVNARFDRFNERLRGRKENIEKALSSADSRFMLVIAYSGQEPLAPEPQRDFDDLLREMNDPSDVLSLRVLRQASIHGILASGAMGAPINLEVALRQWGHMQAPYDSYYGQVGADEVAAWYTNHPKLFAPNLRTFLGSTEVNDSLMKTLRSEPEKFWFFNNGITALCGSIKKKLIGGNNRDVGYFECSNVSIVNGAQTVGAIAAAAANHPAAVSKASVQVRFICLSDCPDSFASEVTRATNTQNKIERSDFVSLDPVQEQLRVELQLDGVAYFYKPGERLTDPRNGFTVYEATVALACSCSDVAMAVQAKREIGKLWDDITRPPYKTLFNSQTSGKQIWRRVRVLRTIEMQLAVEHNRRDGRGAMVPVHGNRFVAYQVFKRLGKEPLDTGEEVEVIRERARALVPDVIDRVAVATNLLYPDSYLASLFKNVEKCRRIDEVVNSPKYPVVKEVAEGG